MLRLLTQQCQWNWHTEVSLITLSQTRWVIDTTESDFLSHWYHWVRLAESLIPPRQTRWVRLAESLISLSLTRWVIDTAELDSLSHWYRWVRLAESLIPLSQTRWVIDTTESDSLSHWYRWVRLAVSLKLQSFVWHHRVRAFIVVVFYGLVCLKFIIWIVEIYAKMETKATVLYISY